MSKQVNVPPEMFDEMEAKWAPRDDPVFKLVPDAFHDQISAFYDALDRPVIALHTFWAIYVALLNMFTPELQQTLANDIQHANDHFEESAPPPLLAEQANLPAPAGAWGYDYLGGLANPPPAQDPRKYAEFTDDEPDE